MWTMSTASKNIGETYPFSFFWQQGDNSNGEHRRANNSVSGRTEVISQTVRMCRWSFDLLRPRFLFFWLGMSEMQLYPWGFLPALFERLISLSFLLDWLSWKKGWNFHQQNIYIVNYGQSWNCHFVAVISNQLQHAKSGGKYWKESEW